MPTERVTTITERDLFALRVAAAMWLSANPKDLNAEEVRRALLATQRSTE